MSDKQEFIAAALHKLILVDGMQDYRDRYFDAEPSKLKDPKNKLAIEALNKLSTEEKESIINLSRTMVIDTVSEVLGVIDGSSWLSDDDIEFELKDQNTGDILNGSLQDYFLEIVEKS